MRRPTRRSPPRLAVAAFALMAVAAIGPRRMARSQSMPDDEDAPAAPRRPDIAAQQAAYRAERDDKRRAKLVADMGGPGSAEVLETVIETDASDDVALAAAYALRRAAVGTVVASLERRLATGARDAPARERLLRDIERHQMFAAGQNLPHFLRDAPPVFSVKADKHGGVRVLAFGDFGNGSERQRTLAEAMQHLHEKKPFTFAVTLGDNFYPTGMSGPRDPRWERDFNHLYGGMRIPFFPSLGNHDWSQTDSPAAEILHSHEDPRWRMPAVRYTFVAGPVQFFAIDTSMVTRAELEWLDREIGRSTARWKIVYGHHPVFSDGKHGGDPVVHDSVFPLLKGRVDVYLCGHEHDLQHLAPVDGVEFVIVGGGGAEPRPIAPGPRSLFAASKNGFGVIEATRKVLTFSFIDGDLRTLHSFKLGE